jgi:CIC family chloride channel protein
VVSPRPPGGDSGEPIGEDRPVDVAELPDVVGAADELELRGYRGVRRLLDASGRWAVLAVAAGLVAGVGACGFVVGLNVLVRAVNDLRAALPWWAIAFFPATGGLAVGYILWRSDRVAFVSACGTDSFIDAVHEADGHIPARVPVLRIIGAWLTIGFGGSSGRECPMIYTGAGLGSTTGEVLSALRTRLPGRLARLLDLNRADTRLLALCGAAGALGAIFSAPVGGAIFAVEVPYRRHIEMGVFWPALVSSIVGFAVGRLLIGRQFLLHISVPGHLSGPEWILVGVIAIAGSLAARGFAVCFNGFHSWVRKNFHEDRRLPKWCQTGIGGLFAGLVMLAFPQVYGIGYQAIHDMAAGRIFTDHTALTGACLLLALGAAKVAASSFTVGTGGVGGLLFPSLFAGAAVGGALGTIAHGIWPADFTHQTAYVLIAMSATYAAAGKVPAASLLLVCEATLSFTLAIPMACANTAAYLLSGRSTVYDVQRTDAADPRRRFGYLVAGGVVAVTILLARLGLHV